MKSVVDGRVALLTFLMLVTAAIKLLGRRPSLLAAMIPLYPRGTALATDWAGLHGEPFCPSCQRMTP
jgi:hypothetical protein